MSFNRTSSADALKNVFGNRAVSMPMRDATGNRLQSPVKPIILNNFTLNRSDKVFTIGSCFARNIEDFLRNEGFDLSVFKFAVPTEELNAIAPWPTQMLNKYTPFSMTNEVNGAFGELDLNQTLVEVAEGSFLDMQLHTNVGVPIERAIERRQYINEFNRKSIQDADVIIITLGLIESWFDESAGMYLNQAPSAKMMQKLPNRFKFEVLSPDVVGKEVRKLIDLLLKYGKKGHNVLLTVSPVPIGRSFTGDDVIVANCYSKSVLRTYAEVLKNEYEHVDYVPTYEAITLSDRETTWLDDNIHVTKSAVDSIIGHVMESYLEKEV